MKKNSLTMIAMLFALSLMAITANAQETETVQIGNGTARDEIMPICNWDLCTYEGTESLYLKNELGLKSGDKIIAISYNCISGYASGGNFNVRMKNTDITSFKPNYGFTTDDTSIIEINYDEQIYGNTTLGSYSAGDWITFTLSTPFIYTGGNIIIDIRNTAPSDNYGNCFFAVTNYSGADNRRSVAWKDAISENVHADGFCSTGWWDDPGIWGFYEYENSSLPNIRITYIPSNYNYDVNGDGHINGADITAIYDYMLGL